MWICEMDENDWSFLEDEKKTHTHKTKLILIDKEK